MNPNKKILKGLVGQSLIGFLRYSDAEIFYFGSRYALDTRGKLIFSTSIHTDCAWRILGSNEKLFVGSDDVWVASKHGAEVDLNKQTLRDSKLAEIERKFCTKNKLKVKSASLKKSGDITLNFSSGHILEIFLNGSTRDLTVHRRR